MENARDILNISSLPSEARSQLRDFYEFLYQKYVAPQKIEPAERKERFSKFLARPVKVKELKFLSREALHERN